MRVLVITNLFPPEFLGGYELGCAQMVGALTAAGHDVRVVTSVSAHGAGAEEARVHRVLATPPIYNLAQMGLTAAENVRYLHTEARAVNPGNVRALADAIAGFDPDVAYLWNILGLGGFGVLALLAHQGIPWVWHIMDLIPRELCRFDGLRPQLAAELGRIFPGRYIMCSGHVLGEIRAGGVEVGDEVYVVPNWVDGTPPAPRRDYYSGGTLRMLTASGSLSEEKGTRILIETAAVLRQNGDANFRIDIFGREHGPEYRQLIVKLGLSGLVRLMGTRSQDQLLALYDDYDVLAFPTWTREPFGFVGLEAAARGCVPLCTADCGMAEWMIDGVDCVKAPRTPGGFAKRIAEILHGELDLAPIGRRGQAVVWREFHISGAAAQVERILAGAAAERRIPRGSASDFFALARFAEGLTHALVQEALV